MILSRFIKVEQTLDIKKCSNPYMYEKVVFKCS